MLVSLSVTCHSCQLSCRKVTVCVYVGVGGGGFSSFVLLAGGEGPMLNTGYTVYVGVPTSAPL